MGSGEGDRLLNIITMAKIHSIKIQHYRGIDSFEQIFGDNDFIVIIGRGDSGKSTILKAISCVLSPAWNLAFSDSDFYACDTSTPIKISVTMYDIPPELLRDDKFGLYFRLLKDGIIVDDVTDEDANQSEHLLTIELIVDETLEPRWYIVTNREGQEPKEISSKDRSLLNMFYVADYADSHFAYSRQSPLTELLRQDGNNVQEITKNLQHIVRTIYEHVSKTEDVKLNFDDSTDKIKKEAKKLGLDIDTLNAALEYKENAYTESHISLHSNNIPYRLNGKGTKRLMSMAIQLALAEKMGILLIDEIEQGLEPDRIRNIVRVLKKENKGQIFITTHANGTVLEADAKNIFLMRKGNTCLQTFSEDLQGALRHHPEVFFAKACVFCEGATEYGFLRAIDNAIQQEKGYGLATMGVGICDAGGGNNFFKYAESMIQCGCDAVTFSDNDIKDMDDLIQKANQIGLKMCMCDKGLCLEKQIFHDVPWDCVLELLSVAIELNDEATILSGSNYSHLDDLKEVEQQEQTRLREYFGKKASTNNWYKRVDKGEKMGDVVLKCFTKLNSDSQLYKEISSLKSWMLQYAID